MNQKIIIMSIILVGIVVAVAYISLNRNVVAITSFDECVAAGYPVMESYPRQCRPDNGPTFTEDISGDDLVNEGDISEERGTVVISGVITEVDGEGVALDGPFLVTLETSYGDEAVVAVPSMGIRLCPAYDNIADAFALEVGQSVEVRGYATSEGQIVPCESADHYLRVAQQ